MSRMTNIIIEIEELLMAGKMADEIAEMLSIPLSWVYDTEDRLSGVDEPWDGFNSDAEADADALASAGWGTDEDYGVPFEGDF